MPKVYRDHPTSSTIPERFCNNVNRRHLKAPSSEDVKKGRCHKNVVTKGTYQTSYSWRPGHARARPSLIALQLQTPPCTKTSACKMERSMLCRETSTLNFGSKSSNRSFVKSSASVFSSLGLHWRFRPRRAFGQHGRHLHVQGPSTAI